MEMKTWRHVFQDKKVLVFGDTGFKGSWLSLWLHELGAAVCGFALPPDRDDSHYSLLKLGSIIRHVDGDIRDLQQVQGIVDAFKPEILFHLAAQAIVRVSYQEPKYTFDTNVGGSVNILEAVRHSGSLKAVVYITSDKCYRNNEWVWGYRENDTLGGRDPYSASKAAAEMVFGAYLNSFLAATKDFGIARARAGNVIGGGDWAVDRIIPDCIRALKKGTPVLIRNPHSTRPWQHVLAPLSGYLTLAAKLLEDPKKFSGSYNFGPRVESIKTVKELVDQVISGWGHGEARISPQVDAPHEDGILHLNCDKASQLLGWYPLWDFDRTILETVKWYKQVSTGQSTMSVTKEQIASYMGD
ncbi:MAG: CDP-glucose 4,6-dehydratase [Candidatus Omnitrophica bacterium]|nr:CDP-glucose 4,6-dehydratase [Candidatus Omnitrophota bacterium]